MGFIVIHKVNFGFAVVLIKMVMKVFWYVAVCDFLQSLVTPKSEILAWKAWEHAQTQIGWKSREEWYPRLKDRISAKQCLRYKAEAEPVFECVCL